MRMIVANQKGAVLMIFAFLLFVLIGFAALAMEAGRWYMVRAELSKSVDAAALAGAKNISNPYVDPLVLAREFGQENFPSGYAGTPPMGTTGTVVFNAVSLSDHRIQVTGSVTALANLAQLFGVNQVLTAATGVAKRNAVEIMLVLDRSGSMGFNGGQPIADLKTAAKSFVSFFDDTQNEDKMGLISFATGVTVDVPLGNNYVNSMTSAINKMIANGATNAEDALAQTMGPKGLTDQTAVAPDKRVQQFVIFFTDGNPTAFRTQLKDSGNDRDAVVMCGSYSGSAACDTVWTTYADPNTGNDIGNSIPCGDGLPRKTSSCGYDNTHWNIFDAAPVAGYSANSCHQSTDTAFMNALQKYIAQTTKQMALDQAQTLKNRFVKIYIIGLGQVDRAFLHQVASGDAFEYYAPTSSELQAIFNAIAKDIKLRLVQ